MEFVTRLQIPRFSKDDNIIKPANPSFIQHSHGLSGEGFLLSDSGVGDTNTLVLFATANFYLY